MTKDLFTVKLKTYLSLTKPGIIRGNLMTAAAAFLLAARGQVNLGLLAWSLVGIALIIASGCVFNNYLDRGIDKIMERTSGRVLVTGIIKSKPAIIYASGLGLTGLIVLGLYVNILTMLLGILALFVYVVVYGIAKRRSVHGTLVGSIAGAMPLVAGYTAATNSLDAEALILFLILAAWQMPHFYAIAIYRRNDYAKAGIPVLPVIKGVHATKVQILAYIVIFSGAVTALYSFGYASSVYLVMMLLACLAWLRVAVKGFKEDDDARWGRKLFGFSLIVLTIFSLMISLDSLLA